MLKLDVGPSENTKNMATPIERNVASKYFLAATDMVKE
jgi:hypothetical protein